MSHNNNKVLCRLVTFQGSQFTDLSLAIQDCLSGPRWNVKELTGHQAWSCKMLFIEAFNLWQKEDQEQTWLEFYIIPMLIKTYTVMTHSLTYESFIHSTQYLCIAISEITNSHIYWNVQAYTYENI